MNNTVYGTVRGNGAAHPAYMENGNVEVCCSCPNTANGRINTALFNPNTPATCKPGKWTVKAWAESGYINGVTL